jgi:hypothetical protein
VVDGELLHFVDGLCGPSYLLNVACDWVFENRMDRLTTSGLLNHSLHALYIVKEMHCAIGST